MGGWVAVLAAVAGAVAWWQWPRAAPPKAAGTVVAAPLPDRLLLSGTAAAQRTVPVPAPIEGTLEMFLVEVGQEVAEGQPLAQIRNEGLEAAQATARQELERAESRLSQLEAQITAARLEASRARAEASRIREEAGRTERTYRRHETLLREGATPRLVFEKWAREHEQSQAELTTRDQVARSAEERLAELSRSRDQALKLVEDKRGAVDEAQADAAATELKSPLEGVVVARRGQAGDVVNRLVPDLLQIAVELSQLQVTVPLPGGPAGGRVAPGQPALVRVPEMSAEAMAGQVASVQEGQAVVTFVSPDPALKPGATVQVEIPLQKGPGPSSPQ